MHKRSFRRFTQDDFLRDVGNIDWSNIYDEKEHDGALELFLKKFQSVIDKHAPVRKLTGTIEHRGLMRS